MSFDEGGERIRRNLTSVGIHLDAHVKSGLLRMYSGRDRRGQPGRAPDQNRGAASRASTALHGDRSAVGHRQDRRARSARAVGNRLIYQVRDHNITAFITSLVEGDDPQAEATELQISTIADTWIHLSYLVRGGERNRALTIVKSRGTQHSNQVRELVLSAAGPALTDVYSSGGEVLMGTLRWEKESRGESPEDCSGRRNSAHKRRELQFAEADITARIAALQARSRQAAG